MKRSSIYLKSAIFIFTLFITIQPLRAQDVQVSAGSNRVNIPPYIRDWEAAADLFFINLSCTFPQPTPIFMVIELSEERLGRIAYGESEVIYAPNTPFNRIINNTDFMNWDNWEYDDDIRQQAERTGRLPDGVYNLCVEILTNEDQMPMAQFCYMFEIFLPQNVQLILPDDVDEVSVPYPIFQWTPIPWSAPVTYHLVVVQLNDGQYPQDAMAANDIFFEEFLEDENMLIYPPTGLPYENGKYYAWMVIAEDEFGNRVGDNNGESQVYSFSYVGNAMANVMDWRDSVKMYTAPGFLAGVTIKDDPCPSIQDLINSIQSKLRVQRSKHEKAARKKAEGEAQAERGKQAVNEADAAITKAEASLKKAKQQRDVVLNKINKDNGASVVSADTECEGSAKVDAGNGGSLKLDPGTALCIPKANIEGWLSSFNAQRKTYEMYANLVREHSKTISDQKAKKAKGERDKAEGAKKAKEGSEAMADAAKEIADLEEALRKLIPRAKECNDVIIDLKAAAKKASAVIIKVGVKVEAATSAHGTGGSKAGETAGGAKDKLDEAEEAFEKGEYEKAAKLAAEAELEVDKVKTAAEREDCYKRAKAKVEKAKADLAERKEVFPESDFAKAEGAIALAESDLAKLKQAISDGDYALALVLCNKIIKTIDDEFYPAMTAIRCNEGQILEGYKNYITEYKTGYLYLPTQVGKGNVGYELKKLLENHVKFDLGISYYVDKVYKLSSLAYAYDVYSVWTKYYGIYDLKCIDGIWVTQNGRGYYTKVYFKKEHETVKGEVVVKLMKENGKKLHDNLVDRKLDEIMDSVYGL